VRGVLSILISLVLRGVVGDGIGKRRVDDGVLNARLPQDDGDEVDAASEGRSAPMAMSRLATVS